MPPGAPAAAPCREAEIPELFSKDDRGLSIPLLQRLSRRIVPLLPAGVTPNHVTWAGLVALALSGAAFALTRFGLLWLLPAALGLLLHALLDVVDGDLARARQAHSTRGMFLDLFCDNLGAAFVGGGLMLTAYATAPIVAVAFAAYSAAAMTGFLALVMLREMPMPPIGPTETEILLAIVALGVLATGGACWSIGGLCLSLFDVAALGWLVLAVRLTATLGTHIYRRLGAVDAAES